MKTFLLFLLCAISAIAAPKDITPLITSATWKWDHPTVKGRTLKFKADGTCETTNWKGVWKTEGERTVVLTQSGNLKTTITFNEQFTAFTGRHHDGLEIVGRRLGEVPSSLK